ncbi:hypothetical protein U1Q18_031720 [Sarracenia purpurea var. burkii]
MGVQVDDENMKREDSPVSDSEKIGAAIFGRHFANKVEHIPFKKRRLLFQFPSPPSRTSSALHEEALSSQCQSPSPQPKDSDPRQFDQGAAPNNSTGDDAHNDKEVTPVEESSTLDGIKSSLLASSLEKTTTSMDFQNKIDCEGKRLPCLKYDRLHWDLNTLMEEWELPFDDSSPGCQINGTEGMSDDVMSSKKENKLEGGVLIRDPKHALEQLKFSTADTEGGNGHLIGFGKMTAIQAGYESPLEDGELRESWEKNKVKGEIECVDFDSDNSDADDYDTANCCINPEVGFDNRQNLDNGSMAKEVVQHGRADEKKESSHVVSLEEFYSQDKSSPEGFECSTNRVDEVNGVDTPKNLTSDSIDGLKCSSTREVGSSAAREKSFSDSEGPSCFEDLEKTDTVYMHWSSYDAGFQARRVFGSEKPFRRDRPIRRMQDGSREYGHRVDSFRGYWDSRNRSPSGYHAPHGNDWHPSRRSGIEHYAAKFDGFPNHNKRRSINYSSKAVYRPIRRRRSPSESDDAYSAHRRMVRTRNNSRWMSSSRSRIYRPRVFKGPWKEYNGLISENCASSSVCQQDFLVTTERSFCQSRSQSPLMWHFQRERNMGARCLSRSPDFRSEDKMETIKMALPKLNFEADNEDVVVPPPTSQFFVPCYSRWSNDRNCLAAHLRERKSPKKFLRQSLKFDPVSIPQRMKSDDYYNSIVHPGRLTELSGDLNRVPKYSDTDFDTTKHGNRYELIHRVKQCDTGRQFCFNAEDCFEAHNNTRNEDSCIGDTARRDVPRSTSETGGSFGYDGKNDLCPELKSRLQ